MAILYGSTAGLSFLNTGRQLIDTTAYGQTGENGAIEVLPGSVNGAGTGEVQMLGGAQLAGGSTTFYAGWALG